MSPNWNWIGSIMDGGVPREKVEDCLQWAFGADYKCLPLGMLPTKWEQLHENLPPLQSHELVSVALKKVGEFYVKEVMNANKD